MREELSNLYLHMVRIGSQDYVGWYFNKVAVTLIALNNNVLLT